MNMESESCLKFSDLLFKDCSVNHPAFAGKQAITFFTNGYGVSVVKYSEPNTNGEYLYETAVLKGNKDKWRINCNEDNWEEVTSYITEKGVTEIMLEVQLRGKNA